MIESWISLIFSCLYTSLLLCSVTQVGALTPPVLLSPSEVVYDIIQVRPHHAHISFYSGSSLLSCRNISKQFNIVLYCLISIFQSKVDLWKIFIQNKWRSWLRRPNLATYLALSLKPHTRGENNSQKPVYIAPPGVSQCKLQWLLQKRGPSPILHHWEEIVFTPLLQL